MREKDSQDEEHIADTKDGHVEVRDERALPAPCGCLCHVPRTGQVALAGDGRGRGEDCGRREDDRGGGVGEDEDPLDTEELVDVILQADEEVGKLSAGGAHHEEEALLDEEVSGVRADGEKVGEEG